MERQQAIEAGESAAARRLRHRGLREDIPAMLAQASPGGIAAIPVIYSLIIPIALLDLWATVYQRLCFRAYGLPQIRRSDHLVLDRQKLAYLNAVEAFNCRYCSYANGVLSYVRAIAGVTEEYWCPIKHSKPVPDPHGRYAGFLPYGDAEAYRAHVASFRARRKRRRAQ